MENLAKIKELQKQINIINGVIEELITSEMKQQNNSQIDIKRIESLGKQATFQSHFVSFLDEDVAVKYCTLLASAVRLLEDTEKKIRQYYFISRILHSSKAKCSLEEIITNAELVGISEFAYMKQELAEDIKVFLFDLLLQISLVGKIEEKQLDYFCEVLAYVDMNEKDRKSLFRVVSCVLQENIEELFKESDAFPVKNICGYFKEFDVAYSIEEVSKAKKDKVIIVAVKDFKPICSTEKITKTKTENGVSVEVEEIKYHLHLDELKKKTVIFVECEFDNIDFMDGITSNTIFENCDFNECGAFSLKKALVNKCCFRKCGNEKNIMLKIELGQIEKCIFDECSVTNIKEWNEIKEKSLSMENGALICLEKGLIAKSTCNRCKVVKEGDRGVLVLNRIFRMARPLGTKLALEQDLNIICLNKGSIQDCRFSECTCEDAEKDRSYSEYSSVKINNYLINLVDGTAKDNIFERCIATANVGAAKWEEEA